MSISISISCPICIPIISSFTTALFSLSGNRISDDGTLALGKMLKANQTLQELKWVAPLEDSQPEQFSKHTGAFCVIFSLSRNELSDHGASILGEMLKVNQSLKKLKWVTLLENLQPENCSRWWYLLLYLNSLCGNRITHRGVAVLAEMLKVNESLVKLKWVENTFDCMKHIGAFCPIFSLSGNGISDRGASVLGEALKVNKSLRELKWVAPTTLTDNCSKHTIPSISSLASVGIWSLIAGHQHWVICWQWTSHCKN